MNSDGVLVPSGITIQTATKRDRFENRGGPPARLTAVFMKYPPLVLHGKRPSCDGTGDKSRGEMAKSPLQMAKFVRAFHDLPLADPRRMCKIWQSLRQDRLHGVFYTCGRHNEHIS